MADATIRDALASLIERARKDPDFFHKLVFDPEAVMSSLPDIRELRAAVYGIDPGGLFGAQDRLVRPRVFQCAETCGSQSCQQTCDVASCDHTCLSSCHATCGLSCGFTTHLA